jgi:hypothetical protein
MSFYARACRSSTRLSGGQNKTIYSEAAARRLWQGQCHMPKWNIG